MSGLRGISRDRLALALAVVIAASLSAGCRSARTPAAEAPQEPLPPQALLTLDEIEPVPRMPEPGGHDGAAHYALGMTAVSDGKPAEAIFQFRTALMCPGTSDNAQLSVMVHYRLACSLEGQGYLIAALDQYRAYESELARLGEATLVDPELAGLVQANGRTASPFVASLCERLKRSEAAETLLRRALAASPSFLTARAQLSRMYLAQYRWDEAIRTSRTEGEPHPLLERILAEAYAGLDDFEQATAHYNEALRLNPSDSRSMTALAELFERADNALLARRYYEQALKENPLDVRSRESLAMLYLGAGERTAAEQQIAELRKMAAPVQAVERCLARFEFDPAAPDYPRLRRTLLESLRGDPIEAPTAFLVASSLLAEQDFAVAGPYVEQGLAQDPNHEGLLEVRIWIYRQQLDFERARDELRRLVQRYPNRKLWLSHLFDVLVIEQAHEDVVALARAMLRLKGFSGDEADRGRREYLASLRALGRTDEAVALARQWCDAEPRNAMLRERLVDTLVQAGRHDEALAAIQSWPQEGDDQARRRAMVKVLTRWKHLEQACQFLTVALEENPDDEERLLELIDVLIEAGRFDDALELAEANAAEDRRRFGFEYAALQAYDAAGRHDDAIRLIQQWIYRSERGGLDDLAIGLDRVRAVLVEQLLAAGRFDDARNRLNGWLDEEPDLAQRQTCLTLVSECYRRAGRTKQGLEALELAHSLNPRDVNLCNSLAYSWVDAGMNLDRAEALLRYAVAQEPRNAAYLDSLGWVLYKKGDFAGALRWLELARGADDTADPVIHDHLGDTYWHLGNPERAAERWRTAMESARQEVGKHDDPAWREVMERAPAKIEAVDGGRIPEVAPVGPAP